MSHEEILSKLEALITADRVGNTIDFQHAARQALPAIAEAIKIIEDIGKETVPCQP